MSLFAPRQHPAFDIKLFHSNEQIKEKEIKQKNKAKNKKRKRNNDNDGESKQEEPVESQEASATAGNKSLLVIEDDEERLIHNRGVLHAIKTKHSISRSAPIPLWFKSKLATRIIQKRRLRIKRLVLVDEGKSNRDANGPITTELLQVLMRAYDKFFFNEQWDDQLKIQETKFVLEMGENKHEFKKGCAGFCELKGDFVTIAFHPGLNQLVFAAKDEKQQMEDPNAGEEINGIICFDRLDCAQIILEHEFVHLMLQVFLRKIRVSHGKEFKELANGLFGHTLFTHAIGHGQGMVRVEREKDREQKYNECNVGDVVKFSSNETKRETKRPSSQCACIVVKGKDNVVLVKADGSLVERVPYQDIDKNACTTEGATATDKRKRNAMAKWAEQFLENKKTSKIGFTVRYLTFNDKQITGKLVSKKATGIQVAVNHRESTFVPYHCFEIV